MLIFNKPKKQFGMKKHFLCLLLLAGTGIPAYAAESASPALAEVTQQAVIVKGAVKDAKGEPIIGATVTEKGTKNATVTDFNGNYSLRIGQRDALLIVSYIGFVAQEVKPGSDVVLEEDLKSISEVVVIGYGTQRKGDVTSAITSVKAEDFAQGNIHDAGSLIKGKVAGLTISNGSGDPSVASSIRLRGIISLEGGNSPLVLVDGIEGSLTAVAPENIESIDVLKDASAAAIYGTRGAAGVILITTKAGRRESKTTASYSGYASIATFGKKLDMMNGTDIRAGKTNYTDRGYDTDWLDAITRTALTHNHNVSLNGGNKSTSYAADFTYRDQQGVFIKTYGKDMHFNGSISHWMFNDMLKLNFNILKRWHENGPVDAAGQMVYRQALMRNPTEPIYAENGSYYENFGINYYYNPVGILKEQKGEYKTETTRLTGNITVEPVKGWQTNLMLSTERYNAHDEGYQTSKYYGQVSQYKTGYAYHSYAYNKTENLELTSTYKHQWGNHRFEALVGYSYQYTVDESFYANNTNFQSDFFEYNNLGAGQYLKEGKAGMGSGKGDDTLVGFFGRISYGFSDRYNVLLSVRREGSSKFGDNHKWGSFPSVSLGWTISNESFMKGTRSWLDNLKLRAGCGVTGVIPSDRYRSLTTWALGNPYYYDEGTWKQGLSVDQNPNPDLKWEKSTEYNVGIDWAVLGERIWGSVDLYHKKTVDMLWWYDVPVPPNLYNQTLANVGEMRNQGIEAAINAIPMRTKDFEWKTTVTFAHNATKLLSLSNDLYETANRHYIAYLNEPITLSTQVMEVGRPLGQWYGLKSVGVSEKGLWLIENPKTGAVEEFNDNMLTDKETYYQKLGNAIPKFNVGWSNTLRYKDFDLNMQFTGQFGFKILNEARAYYQNNAVVYNRLKDAAEAPYSDGHVLANHQKQTFVSYYLSNGNYMKLSNLTLGYNIPLKENKFVSRIRFYASADNVFTITSYNGLDPELSNGNPQYSGIDSRDKYPTIRTYTFGLNVTF